MEARITKDAWMGFADSTGDNNPIHRNDEAAKKFGLDKAICPGMYVASLVHREITENPVDISITFRNKVGDGSIIKSSEENNVYSFFEIGGDEVCRVKLKYSLCNPIPIPTPSDEVCVYQDGITEGRIRQFCEAVGVPYSQFDGQVPAMYLVSTSAPALLTKGAKEGKVGMHIKQTSRIIAPLKLGDLEVSVEDAGGRPELRKLKIYWKQEKNVVAWGNALVKPL